MDASYVSAKRDASRKYARCSACWKNASGDTWRRKREVNGRVRIRSTRDRSVARKNRDIMQRQVLLPPPAPTSLTIVSCGRVGSSHVSYPAYGKALSTQ